MLIQANEQKVFWTEFTAISQKLKKFTGIFYKMWSYGWPVLTTKIPTAAALFDKNGQSFKFLFNPEFWATLNDYDRAFVVSHECLHMLLNHGKRGQFAQRTGRQEQANIAMDLAVNHMLEDYFGFNRKLLGQALRGKTLFNEDFYPEGVSYTSEDSFEEHYLRITNLINEGKLKEEEVVCNGFDDHSYMKPNETTGADSKLKKIARELTAEEKKKLAEACGKKAGTEEGMYWLDINASRPRKKREWVQCFRKWTHNSLYHDDDREENFMRIDRRLLAVQKQIGNLLLPGENPTYLKKKELRRIQLCLFLDVSGSCVHLKDYFFEAARSMPTDRFEIRGFTFDTSVQEVDIYTDRIVGGGGTSFTCIEEYIQTHLAVGKKKYPKCVCVYTDGYGDNVNPIHPERWYWFLTSEHSQDCIPKDSNMFYLADFIPHVDSV